MTLPPYPFARPDDDACTRAAGYIEDAVWRLEDMRYRPDKDANWNLVTGLLQDGLAELGFDLVPLKPHPIRTPEAIYDDAAYARGRGGV